MTQKQPPQERRSPGASHGSNALVALAAGAIGLLLYFAHAAFIPIALSLLFALVLSSPVEALHRRGVPRTVSALVILALFLGLVGTTLNVVWEPAQQWFAAVPRTEKLIEQKFRPLALVMRRVDEATTRAGRLGSSAGGTPASSTAAAATPFASDGILTATSSATVAIVTIVILTLFLLSGGPPMLARMTATVSAEDTRAAHVLRVVDAVRSEVGRYYSTIALINIGLGIATSATMLLLGMPSPFLWGTLAAVLNFIPYVGSAATLVVLTIVAFVSFDSVGRVVVVAASYLVLATIEGQVVQPLLVGRRLDLNPIIVFLSLWLGGWFWGIAGIVMAVPSLVTLKVLAEHSERGAPLVQFLSPSGVRRLASRRERPSDPASRDDSRGKT